MKKKLISLITLLSLLSFSSVFAKESKQDIVILYENDVHCAVDGYAKLAAMKSEEKSKTDYVSVISCGDFIQGASLGVASKGEYIIRIMNEVGYDVVTPGNHEFDYSIPRLKELTDMLKAKTVSCNFFDTTSNKTYFEPYTMISYGDIDIAYIGISTPETIQKSTPTFFQNENGEYVYNFCPEDLYETVQQAITDAEDDGAEYIIGVSHLGSEDVTEGWKIQDVVANTQGFDAVLDGHSHSVVQGTLLPDSIGKEILMTSTGTAFANIGKLTISADGEIKSKLIPLEEYTNTDEKTLAVINEIKEEHKKYSERVIGKSEVLLSTVDKNGFRAVRNSETNIGDFCADAFRAVLKTDIGFSNGGGIRANISEGDITFNNILNMFPWDNKVCSVKTTGQNILDMLELSASAYPNETGGFLQVSGITFDIDADVSSSVELDSEGMFTAVAGERRVKNVKVENSETGAYEPIVPDKEYTIGSTKYILTELGDGYSMLKDAEIIEDSGVSDSELIEQYIKENLGGVIGSEYAESQQRIKILNNEKEYIMLRKTFESMGYEVIWTELEPDTIYVKSGDVTLVFTAGTNIIKSGEKNYETEKSAYIENGITYISEDSLNICNYLINA